MRVARRLPVVMVCALLGACGSMFPNAQAERAADKVLDEIMSNKGRDVPVSKSGGSQP
jgi:hypothetical protein